LALGVSEGVEATEAAHLVAAGARQASDGSLALLALAEHPRSTRLRLTGVTGQGQPIAGTIPVEGTVIGEVYLRREATSRVVSAADAHLFTDPCTAAVAPAGPVMLAPLLTGTRCLGVLVVCRSSAAAPFVPTDVDLLSTYARHAAAILDLLRTQEIRARSSVYEDRDRIARDLHDHVIQRMFAVALGIQGMLEQVPDGPTAERLQRYVGELDATIHQIRRTIFALQEDPDERPGLRRELLDVVRHVEDALGFAPRLLLDGPLDSTVPDDARSALVATVREALSNTVKHAGASFVEISVLADPRRRLLEVKVEDDGAGPATSPTSTGLGLHDLERRARDLGGTCELRARPGGGSCLFWSIPLAL
ncbi:MAG TPA: histidine kinase, partial [Actinopolymorphaceae bacterium]